MMDEVGTIFIFTASWGNGHNTAAKGLQEREELKGNIVKIFDIAEVSSGARIITKFWNFISRKPFLWKIFYKIGNTKNSSFFIRWILKKSFSSFLKKCFQKKLPDEIFLTNPLLSEVIDSILPEKINKTIFITDYYAPHFFWTWGESTRIFCLDTHAKNYLQKNIPQKHYAICDFPLPKNILQAKNYSEIEREDIQKNMGITGDAPIFTFLFHHFLFGNEEEVFWKYWEIHKSNAIYIIITGKNEKFLKNIFPPFPEIHFFTWIEDMSQIYAISNLIISKAGGAIIGECQALQMPLDIYNALPGHEEANWNYWKTKTKNLSDSQIRL